MTQTSLWTKSFEAPGPRLAVFPRDLVDAFCWGEALDAGVGSMVIVEVDPGGVGVSSVCV